MGTRAAEPGRGPPGTVAEVFWTFLRLGLTSFGGPIAHLGYFRETFVERRRWLEDGAYADLVALCHFLPGPTSSQVGMAIGLHRAGIGGLLAAVAVCAAAVLLLAPGPGVQVAVIVAGGLIGLAWLGRHGAEVDQQAGLGIGVSRAWGVGAAVAFAGLLVFLPLSAALTSNPTVDLVDVFYRAGSLVFGGGHVVLPLLEAETVQTGLVDHDTFLAGYGAAQAVPGPLFTFAAFLGATTTTGPTGLLGAGIALVAIFLPAALLIIGIAPLWERLRGSRPARGALAGINAAVVGILAAALYDPVITQGITSPTTLTLSVAIFVAHTRWSASLRGSRSAPRQ